MITESFIATSIATVDMRIPDLGKSDEELAEMSANLDMEFGEYCRFQEIKSQAHASGQLEHGAAQLIYRYLGETPATFNRQSIGVKYVLTQVFAALIEARM